MPGGPAVLHGLPVRRMSGPVKDGHARFILYRLAHLTYPFRYFYSKSGISVNINDYKEQVDDILKTLVKSEKALEINSAGLRQPIKKLSPEFETVRRFKELGGEYITFGSDAHYADDLAKGVQEAYDAMRKAGFKMMTFYQQRTPLQVPIE